MTSEENASSFTVNAHPAAAPRPAFAGWVEPRRLERRPAADGETPRAEGRARIERPGMTIEFDPRRATVFDGGNSLCLCAGSPRFATEELRQLAVDASPAKAVHTLHLAHGRGLASHLHGTFSIVVIDLNERTVLLSVDRFAVQPVCHAEEPDRLAFSDRADCVPTREPRRVEPQALLEYLYFHMIPAPRTVFAGIARLRGGHSLDFNGTQARLFRHWLPQFAESSAAGVADLRDEFRALIERAVKTEAAGHRAGCFLSGGTDSSTIAGFLTQVLGRPASTFSIGFDAAGYDEMAYARIASRHFGTDHHEHYITREELIEGLPRVAGWYDQPFGNSSAVPAYFCSKVAREAGFDKLLAGDGGDELFGGNSRYATQRLLGAYQAVPGAIREHLLEPVLGVESLRRVPLLRKAVGYVSQAKIPMPDRLHSYNLLLRLGVDSVFTDAVLRASDVASLAAAQRAVWAEVDAGSLVNRMLAFDWKYTLADNDLPKVSATAALAGVGVGFPLLDDDLVDFSLRLSPGLKLKGLRLRYFFKEALRGFLPDEIITKKKHGFGLPFGVWLSEHAGLKDLARDALDGIRMRGVVKPGFLDELWNTRLAEHPAYYGEMVWLLIVLELWLRARAPDFSLA